MLSYGYIGHWEIAYSKWTWYRYMIKWRDEDTFLLTTNPRSFLLYYQDLGRPIVVI